MFNQDNQSGPGSQLVKALMNRRQSPEGQRPFSPLGQMGGPQAQGQGMPQGQGPQGGGFMDSLRGMVGGAQAPGSPMMAAAKQFMQNLPQQGGGFMNPRPTPPAQNMPQGGGMPSWIPPQMHGNPSQPAGLPTPGGMPAQPQQQQPNGFAYTPNGRPGVMY